MEAIFSIGFPSVFGGGAGFGVAVMADIGGAAFFAAAPLALVALACFAGILWGISDLVDSHNGSYAGALIYKPA